MKYTFSEKRNLKKIGDGYCLVEITLKGKEPRIVYIKGIEDGYINISFFSYDRKTSVYFNEEKIHISDIEKIRKLSDKEIDEFENKYFEYSNFDYVSVNGDFYSVVGLYSDRISIHHKKYNEAVSLGIISMELKNVDTGKSLFVELEKEHPQIYPLYSMEKIIDYKLTKLLNSEEKK